MNCQPVLKSVRRSVLGWSSALQRQGPARLVAAILSALVISWALMLAVLVFMSAATRRADVNQRRDDQSALQESTATRPIDLRSIRAGLFEQAHLGMSLVHSVDRHSSKSALLPPSPRELAHLAQQARKNHPGPPPLAPAWVPTRSLRRRLAPRVVEELTTRYAAGEAIRALSREYGVSRSGLCQLLLRDGVALRRQGITPEDADEAVRLYQDGFTIRQVVDRVGHSYGTIRKVLHQHGVALNASESRNRAAEERV